MLQLHETGDWVSDSAATKVTLSYTETLLGWPAVSSRIVLA